LPFRVGFATRSLDFGWNRPRTSFCFCDGPAQPIFVEVTGGRLFFDVAGEAGASAPAWRPGFDHALHKPALSALAGVAKVIYLDHRGNGRSSGEDKATCKLAQWGDNVRVLRCPRYREADRLWRVGTRLEVTFSVAADQRHRRARL
jgi:hypothetical protein